MLKKMIGLILLFMLLISCSPSEEIVKPISQSTFKLGTVISIAIYDIDDENLFVEAFDRIQEIEDKMSNTIDDSEINRINNYYKSHGLNEPIEIDQEVYDVIEMALEYGLQSEGRFDISMDPIIELWGIGTPSEHLPESESIKNALAGVGLENIKLYPDHSIALHEGTRLNLGGIAKGYAADMIAIQLQDVGVEKAIINLGGNVKVIGKKSEEVPFKVGLQDPLSERNDYIGIISIEDKTVVTSGDYEKYFEVDGQRYHHIFDPKTGYPYITDVASVTVVCDQSIVADTMSTILYLMDVDEGIEFVNQMDGIECIYITKDRNVYLSNGSIRSDFEITNEMYTIKN